MPNLSVPSWVPFLTSAVKEETLEVDKPLVLQRILITTLAIAAIALAIAPILALASASVHAFVSLTIVLPVVGFSSSVFLEIWLAERAVDQMAVEQYLSQDMPSERVFARLRYNIRALQLLIDRGGNLNRGDKDMHPLLSPYMPLENFKLLVRAGADLTTIFGNPQRSLFEYCACLDDSAYLECLLNSGKFAPKDFSTDEQCDLWRRLGSKRAGHLLKAYGFDVNVKDSQGYTPLLRVIQSNEILPLTKVGYFTTLELVKTLLDCGANPTITVGLWDKKNAFDLNTNSDIKKLLEQS